MRLKLVLLCCVAFGASGYRVKAQTSPSAEQTPCPGDTVDRMGKEIAAQARAFLAKMRKAVASGNKDELAEMVQYPLRVYSGANVETIADKKEFIRRFDQIFVARVKAKILDEKSSRCLFANPQGFMVGNGEVWFQRLDDGPFKIISVNAGYGEQAPTQ